ncbi:MAG: EamA family transporter [Ignavibacteriales bacterium]|nr:EamA family transporter [Ignavibacteriales bacterium]
MNRWKGYLLIAAAAVCWGGVATVVKHLLNVHFDPLVIVQTRVTISCLLLLVYFLVKDPRQLVPAWRDIPLILLVGICGIAGSNYFYYFAIQESTVATAILIQYCAPILVALYATIVQRHRMSVFMAAAIVLAMSGIFLAVGGYNSGIMHATPKAMLYAFIAAIAYSVFNIAGKPLIKKYSVWRTLFLTLLAASLFWGILYPPQHLIAAHYSAAEWGAFAFVSLVSILIPFGCYFAGLHYIHPTQAIVTSTLEPIVAIVSEFLFLGSSMTLVQSAGAALVLGAIMLLHQKTTVAE